MEPRDGEAPGGPERTEKGSVDAAIRAAAAHANAGDVRAARARLVEEERQERGDGNPEQHAQVLVALADLLVDKFLDPVSALKCCQRAYKLSANADTARRIEHLCRVLGKLDTVARLIDLRVRADQNTSSASRACTELGDIVLDLGDEERAAQWYRRALELDPQNERARSSVDDLRVDAGAIEAHLDRLAEAAATAATRPDASAAFLRAARLARRFGSDRYETYLRAASATAPLEETPAILLEGLLARDRADELLAHHRALLADAADPATRATIASAVAVRWLGRLAKPALAAEFLEQAVLLAPSRFAAFVALRNTRAALDDERAALDIGIAALRAGAEAGSSDRELVGLLTEVTELAFRSGLDAAAFGARLYRVSSSARVLGEMMAARPELGAEWEKHAKMTSDGDQEGSVAESASESERMPDEREAEAASAAEPSATTTPGNGEPTVDREDPPGAEAGATAAPSPGDSSAAPAAAVPALSAEARAKLAELDEQIAKFEGMKRWSDVVKAMLQKADILVDPQEQVSVLTESARLYLQRFSNQAEAIKAYERVLAVDATNVEAIQQLAEMYEKRRDWEKLIDVKKREAGLLDPADRPLRYLELARLASERIRKPEVCIDLWRQVEATDPENPEALAQLASFYERARDWAALGAVLEKQANLLSDANERLAILQKLGLVYADKLGDDAGAVRAFQAILALSPGDRRAQEQLKKRYVSLRAWDDLEVFYAQTEGWDELLRTFERESEQQGIDPAMRIDLLFRVARLWADKKGKKDRAAKSYEKILDLDPTNFDAALALAPIYEDAGDAKKLAGVLEVRLGHTTDPDERVMVLKHVSSLYEEKLKDPPRAFDRSLEAFKISPGIEELQDDVARTAAATGRWDDVVDAYRSCIGASREDDERLALELRLGGILDGIGRTDDATRVFESVRERQPDQAQALEALEALYRKTSRYADLLTIYKQKVELAEDAATQREVRYAIAALLENELADAPGAVAMLLEVAETYGPEPETLAALDRLYEKQGKHQELVDVLEQRISLGAVADDAELVAVKFRLAAIVEKHLGDASRAVDLYRDVLTLAPDHEGAREALEAMLPDAALGVRAAEILEPIYETRGDWDRLIRANEILIGSATEVSTRVELLTKIGDTASERLGDGARAFDAYSRATLEAPDREGVRAKLEILAAELERWTALVDLYAGIAEKTQDAVLARTLWVKVASVHEEQTADVDAAVAAYNRVLAAEPSDEEVLAALERLFTRTSRWTDLLGVLRRRVELSADPAEKETLLGRMASIHEEALSQPVEAIACYREVLSIDPTSAAALGALDGLFERQKLWTDLADNLSQQLNLASEPEARVPLMLRLGLLREKQMSDVETAIETYRSVLEIDAGNEAALEALERLLGSTEHQTIVAEILEPIYRETNDWQRLVNVYEIQVQHAESAERRVELLHRIAELFELAGDDPTKAFESFARAFNEDSARDDTQQALERLARVGSWYPELAEVYEARIPALEEPEPQLAAALHMKVAAIHEEQLKDENAAIAHYRRVLEIDEAHMDAATALERIFQVAERYEELAKIYLVKAQILEDLEEKKQYLYRAAGIYEELLERPQDAVEVYTKVLAADSEDIRALDKLIELYLGLEKWNEVLEVYTRKVDLVSDVTEKKQILVEVGTVYEREIGDIDKAIDGYQRILELDPDDLTAINRLDALYQASANWRELLGILEREAELSRDPAEAIGFRYRVAELWDRHLGDVPRAIEGYREILQVAPDHEPTIAALERLISEGREPVLAAGVLEPVYQSGGEWARLIAVHEVQLKHEQDPLRQVDLLHQIADLYEFQLDQPRQGFETFARALPLDNANDKTLGSLERLAEQLNAWGEVVAWYDREIDRLGDEPAKLVDLGIRTAQLYEVQLGNVDRAIDRYRKVLEVEPENAQAITSLDRLFEATERWEELAGVLERETTLAASPEEVLELQFRLGQLFETRLGDLDRAVAQYREILGAAPEHGPTLRALELLFTEGHKATEIAEILEPLYRMQEAWEPLVGVHKVQLEHIEDKADRIGLIHRIAELCEEKINDHARAFEWELVALAEDPTDEHTNAEVDRLARILDGWSDLANALANILEQTEDDATKTAVGKRLARVYETEMLDTQRAEESYLYVLGVDGHDREALEALDKLYAAASAHEQLSQILATRIEASEDDEEKVELHFRLGQLFEHDLGQVDEAIAHYRLVIDQLNQQHAESIRALQNIYTYQEDWPHLYEMYERELSVVSGDSNQAEIYARMAHLAADALNDVPRAVELWAKVLDIRGEDPEALAALGDLYARQENWRDLVDILERQVSIAEDDEHRIGLFTRLGQVWGEKLGRDRNALDSWQRVLELDPGRTEALFAIASIHRTNSAFHELVETLTRIIEVGAATLEDQALRDVYAELGRLYTEQLQQPYDAIDAWRHALEIRPDDLEALDALDALYRSEGQWEQCIQITEKKAQVLPGQEERIALLLSVADMWDQQVGEKDRGVSAFERILEIDPLHEQAFTRIEQLHKDAWRWEQLVELYLGRFENIDDRDERIGLLRKIAEVYEKELKEPGQAFDSLLIAYSEDYANEGTALEVERLAALTNKWSELLNHCNAALQEVTDHQTKVALCLKIAKWYGQQLGHPEYAIPYYQQILALDPNNLATYREMADLYRRLQQWPTLGQVLGRMLTVCRTDDDRKEVLVQMGELLEKQMGQQDEAIKYYVQATGIDRLLMSALSALERLYRQRAQWTELVDVLRNKAEALSDAEEIVDVKLSLGELYELRIESPEDAIRTYREALELSPGQLDALKGLERLFAIRERWAELLDVLERQLDVVASDRDRIALLVRIAAMHEEQFLKPDLAAQRLEQVLDVDPSSEQALDGLARLYRSMGRWQDLIQTYERHIAAAVERQLKIDLFRSIGRVYENELKDLDRAVDAYVNLVALDEDDEDGLDSLARLYERQESFGQALECMSRLVRVVRDPDRQVELRFRMGRILDEQLGDRGGAMEHFQAALDIDVGHLPSLEALRRIYEDSGDWLSASRVLERAVEYTEQPRAKARLLTDLGYIYRDKLDEPGPAVTSFEAALKNDQDIDEAALPLVDVYVAEERWADARPLLDMLVKRAQKREPAEQHRLWFTYGETATRLNEDDLALKAFTQAYNLDATHLPGLRGLAESHFRLKDWEKAFKFFQMILVHHRDALDREQTTEVFYRLGVVKREQGERRKALNMFDKALEQTPTHRPTLEAMLGLYESQGEWEQVIHFKKQLLEVSNDEEKYTLHNEIGDLWKDKLSNVQKAIQAYVEALELQPKNHVMLHKLLGVYQEAKQW
ncbi:MAG: tetratricopeptide repeat protein, partial [Deltaproteobacteria bacterium]|nr:tetratricopeptide repeat protein [Deltaproteobacteria bacterium]